MAAPLARKTISDLDIEARRVLIRADFNVPLTADRGLADTNRIREALPTIRFALQKGARVIIGTHLGRPRGKANPELSVEPIAAHLAEVLGQEVALADEPAGDGVRKVIADLRQGGLAMLENLRFAPGEESNDEAFARALAGYADVYVNDAFASSHRPHASIVGVPRHVSERGVGFLLDREVRELSRLREDVTRPFVVVLGGVRVPEALAVIDAFMDRADAFVVGGAVGNTFLKARGGDLGRSLQSEDRLAFTRSLLAKAQNRDVEVLLPRDLVAAAGLRAAPGRTVSATHVPDQMAALDIGPETAKLFAEQIRRARTVFWHGPMGACDSPAFAAGTEAVARAMAETLGGLTVVAGDETGAAVRRAGVAERLTHVSTGGAAAFELLQGKRLPGLAAVEYKDAP